MWDDTTLYNRHCDILLHVIIYGNPFSTASTKDGMGIVFFFRAPVLRAKESRRITILEKRAQEQFEKDKDEMLGKLKDLGNTVLGRLGIA